MKKARIPYWDTGDRHLEWQGFELGLGLLEAVFLNDRFRLNEP